MRRTNPIGGRLAPIAILTIVAFVVLSGGLAYWQILRASDLGSRGDNPRVAQEAHSEDRGRILDRNGEVLAFTDPAAAQPRVYTRPSLAHVIGYTSIRFGQTGIELAEHERLSGVKSDDLFEFVWNELLNQHAKGDDVVLTIDGRLQDAAVDAMAGRTGAAVAIDPRTGEILAIVSNPAFDPNTIETLGDAIRDDPGRPLLNRATQGLYPPGSTFKTVTAAAALDTGLYKPDTRFACHDELVIDGFPIACANVPEGEGEYDWGFGFVHSINAVFAQTGVDLGWGTLSEYAARFGFETGLGLEIDTSESTLAADPGSQVQLATTAFGQGELHATPLQMALVAATVANEGEVPQPHLVKRIQKPDGGRVLEERDPGPRGRAISREAARTLRDLMVRNVGEAAGAPAAIAGITVAGKTGTAETGVPGEEPHAWFIGFAPASDPVIAVAVIIENGGFGGSVAGPVAGDIMRAALGLR